MDETRARIKDALQQVLEEYGIEATPVPGKKQNAIEFWINGKRYIHSFPTGGALHRAHFNARSQFRNRLKLLGLQPLPPKIARQKVPFIPDFEDELPQKKEPPRAEEAMAEEKTTKQEEPVEPQAAKVVPPLKNAVHGRVFQSPRVLAIELDRELVVEKGNVLVIPLNRPNTILDMTKEQFQLLFEEAPPEPPPQAPPPPPQAMEPRPLPTPKLIMPPPSNQPDRDVREDYESPYDKFTDEELFAEDVIEPPAAEEDAPSEAMNDIMDYLRQRRGAVKAKVIANALRVTIKSVESNLRLMLNKRIVESDPPGFWAMTDKTPPQRRTMQQQHTVSTTRIVQSSPRGPVPAQLGRILAAMAYVTTTTGEIDLTTSMVTKHLDARDSKQYGARMPGAVQLGYVERGKPLPNQRGSHYRITRKGREILRKAGTYPYDCDRLPPPPWLNSILTS